MLGSEREYELTASRRITVTPVCRFYGIAYVTGIHLNMFRIPDAERQAANLEFLPYLTHLEHVDRDMVPVGIARSCIGK